jgi:fluoroquinolone resistance protein
MIENFNKIINNKSFDKVLSMTVIQRKNFLNEVIRSHDLMGLTFAHLTFLDCNFINIDFRHTNFISCDFTNCNFTETIFLKSELDNCNFKNCKIFQSDLTRANFMESNFTDCQFDMVDIAGAVFTQCELIQPKFHKVRLESVTLSKSKIWNSKKCIEVNTVDNVSKIVDDLKLKD